MVLGDMDEFLLVSRKYDMKVYKVILKTDSLLSTLPDSQKIFGAICRIIKYTQSEDILLEYLTSFEKTPWFIHSSMFVNGFLPMPKTSIEDISNSSIFGGNDDKQKMQELSKIKKFRKVKFIQEELYFNYFLKLKMKDLFLEYSKGNVVIHKEYLMKKDTPKFKQEKIKNTRVKKDLMNIANGDEGSLFYDESIAFSKELEYVFYCKSNLDVNKLQAIFDKFAYFGVGNRLSVGKNHYYLKGIEEVTFKAKGYLLISKMIHDNEIDFSKSNYDIHSAIYRSTKEYANDSVIGKIFKLKEGSCIFPLTEKEYYGKVTSFQVNGKTIYHYGIGMVI